MDNTPLFGETDQKTKYFVNGLQIIILLWVAFSVAIGIVFSLKDNFDHIYAVISLLLTALALFILNRWYNDQEDRLHPKFQKLRVLLIVIVVLCGIAVNLDAWNRPEPPLVCQGFYQTASDTCMAVPHVTDCYLDGYCLFVISNQTGCCGNCTLGADQCGQLNEVKSSGRSTVQY